MAGENDRATIVVFSGDLDRALAAFNIANSAASMDMEVEMFFTFWGLNVIRKGGASALKNPLQRVMGMVNRGGAGRLKLSRMNMLGMGTAAMKRLMREFHMPSLQEMMLMAREMGVRFIACTTSMALMGLGEEDFIPEVDEFAGAATYVEKAARSKINLFI